jgi:hypothetical protein
MHVTIGSTTYTEIKNLSFEPQIDITGDSVPINEFSVDIKTGNEIEVGQYAYLYDDLNQLWAKFWITYADQKDSEFVEVIAQSPLTLLDRVILPPVMYLSATSISTALDAVFSALTGFATYTLDSSLQSATVSGYCPEQNARERLQWICFACTAYVRQSFTDTIEIKALDESTVTDIPMNQTYWKPSVAYRDYVTSIELTQYAFVQGTPSQTDEYVTVDDVTYIRTDNTFELTNPDAPATASPNTIRIDDVYLVNIDNVSDIASRLALLYFARQEVSADVINNRTYEPSQKVSVQLDDERGAVGYIESADFNFGLQAKSTLKIVASVLRNLSNLVIKYMYQGIAIATRRYNFPEGYQYTISNPFFNKSSGTHRYIYRPVNEYATGTITAGDNVNEQQLEIALHWYGTEKVLHIISVSSMEFDSEDKVLEIE